MGRLIIPAGPLIPGRPRGRVLARATTPINHAAAGLLTTPVDISSVTLPTERTVEIFMGAVFSGYNYFLAGLYRDVSTLVIKSVANSAGNLLVSWEIREATGPVEKLIPTIVSSNTIVATQDVTVTDVGDLTRARLHPGGSWAATAPAFQAENISAPILIDTTTVRLYANRVASIVTCYCPIILER